MSPRDALLPGLAAVVGMATGVLPFGAALVARMVRPSLWDLFLWVLPWVGAVVGAGPGKPMMDVVLATWLPTAVATALRCGLQAMEIRWRRDWMTALFAAGAAVAALAGTR